MYLPSHFRATAPATERVLLAELIESAPLGTLLTWDAPNQCPVTSPLPVIRAPDGGGELWGHLAARNDIFARLRASPRAWLLLQGPDAYVTPSWYRSGRDVPTWVYVRAEIEVQARIVDDEPGILEILRAQTERYERDEPRPWEFDIPDDLAEPGVLPRAIHGLRLRVVGTQLKLKLSQNRDEADRAGIREGLARRPDAGSRGALAWMERLTTPR